MLSNVFSPTKGKAYEAVKLMIHGYRESFNPGLGKNTRQEVVIFRVFDLYKSFPSCAIWVSAYVSRVAFVWTHEVPWHPSTSDFLLLESRIAL